MKISHSLLVAAVGGILGTTGCGEGNKASADPAMQNSGGATPAMAGAKHACKGQNDCKGQGGCKTEKNSCKGQNECKGQGGCKG